MATSDGLKPVGDLVSQLLKDQGLDRQIQRVSVLDEWPTVVGERVAAMTRAKAVSGKDLIVEVKSSPWLMELNMMRVQILERLNHGHEDAPIERLVFVLGEGF